MPDQLTNHSHPEHSVPAARIVPAALGTLLDAVLDDDVAAGGRTRPAALLAAAVACALATALLVASVGGWAGAGAVPSAAASQKGTR